jgi:hypothetical protein
VQNVCMKFWWLLPLDPAIRSWVYLSRRSRSRTLPSKICFLFSSWIFCPGLWTLLVRGFCKWKWRIPNIIIDFTVLSNDSILSKSDSVLLNNDSVVLSTDSVVLSKNSAMSGTLQSLNSAVSVSTRLSLLYSWLNIEWTLHLALQYNACCNL